MCKGGKKAPTWPVVLAKLLAGLAHKNLTGYPACFLAFSLQNLSCSTNNKKKKRSRHDAGVMKRVWPSLRLPGMLHPLLPWWLGILCWLSQYVSFADIIQSSSFQAYIVRMLKLAAFPRFIRMEPGDNWIAVLGVMSVIYTCATDAFVIIFEMQK